MVAFFLFLSAFAGQRQLYQAGFMAPYANTYSPVAPEMMYASQNMYASPEYVPAQYAYPAAYPVYEQETSDNSWSTVAMLAVAGAVGVSIGYTMKAINMGIQSEIESRAEDVPLVSVDEALSIINNYCETTLEGCLECRDTPDKGKVLHATKPVKVGDVILREDLMVWYSIAST